MEKSVGKFVFVPLLIALLTNSACKKDWFDIKSDKNIALLRTLQDFEMLLDDYSIISSNTPALGEVASDGHYTPDNRWVSFATGNLPIYIVQFNAYTWTKHDVNTDVGDWNMAYKVIFNCNHVIEGLLKIKRDNINKLQYDRVLGNALFLRAKAYFDLSQVFTPPYDPTKDSPFGLPFKEGTDVAERLVRISVHETFRRIEKDLIEAALLLPVKASPVTRGSGSACWALLARMALITGKYEDALTYANLTLKVYGNLLDFSKIPTNNVNLGLFNEEVIFHSTLLPLHSIYFPRFCFIDRSLFDMFEGTDLRAKLFFNVNSSGITFKGSYSNSLTPFAGLAVDEVFLIKAEAYARTNRVVESMEVLNTFLRSRYMRNLDGTSTLVERMATDELDALQNIFIERRKELILRGLRWVDLRRLNFDSRFAETLTRTVRGETYILLPNSPKYAMPIPEDEISYNKLSQNPGWE